MPSTALFWPAFAHVILIIVVMFIMGQRRARSFAQRKQTMGDVAMNRADDFDDEATKAANNYKNQFEMPVLFYAAIAFALALKQADALFVGLAWVFVTSRAIHAFVHLTNNVVAVRAASWLVGVIALLAMWTTMAVRIAVAG